MTLPGPTVVNLQDTEEKQTITMLEGCLKQQRTYTDNTVAECMRLRKIIACCEKCCTEANRPEDGS